MKKLLILALVLGMTALTQAGPVMSVVTSGLGDAGHAGTAGDPLETGETIAIKIVLNGAPGTHSTTSYYDGYSLSSMDLDLTVSSQGVLAEKGTTVAKRMKHHTAMGVWAEPEPAVVNNAVAYLAGTAPVTGIDGAYSAGVDIVWNLIVTAVGIGDITVDLGQRGIAGSSQYSLAAGDEIAWINFGESDLGDLVISAVPEPVTIALLGLGGLFLRRRK